MIWNFLNINHDQQFNDAIQIVLKHEGGLTNDKNDPGGITDYGISLKFLRAAGIDENGTRCQHVTANDIKALTPEKARAIYYKYYWKKYDIYKIDSLRVATAVLDMSVLMGNHEAIICMQRALNDLDRCGLIEDGIMGIRTLSEINRASTSQLFDEYKKELLAYIDLICIKNQKLLVFKNGWYNRINSL